LFLNFLKLFFAFGYNLLFNLYLVKLFNIKTIFHSEKRTNFASAITALEGILYQSLCVLSYTLQNKNYKKVRKCFIDLENLDFCFDFKIIYWRNCKIFMMIVIAYFIITNGFYLPYLSTAPYPAKILILSSVYFQFYLLLLYCIIKIIEEKLVLQMKQLSHSIDYNFSKSSIESAFHSFCRIMNSFKQFREAFIIQFLINIGFFACSITFGVSFIA
jgi:hypothetical protein